MAREILALLIPPLFLLSIPTHMALTIPRSDKEKAGYLGTVHKVITETEILSRKLYRGFDLVEDTTAQSGKGRFLAEEEEFDENGRLVADASSDREMDQEPFRSVYSYDGMDRLSGETFFKRDGSPAGRKKYAYDSAGHKTEELLYDVSGILISRLDYDGRQNLTYSELFRSDGSVIEKQSIVHSYRRDGNTLEDSYAPTPASGKIKDVYTYNDSGQIVKQLVAGIESSFDSSGRIVEEKLGGIRTTYSYDEQGRETERVVDDPFSGERQKFVSKFDSHGNEKERIAYKGDGSVFMHFDWTYDYDSRDNWTRKIEEEKVFNAREDIKPSTLQLITARYRIISYY